MEFADRKLDALPSAVPEGEAEDVESDELLLTKATIRLGLNTIESTADGKNFAYVRLDLQGKRLKTLTGELGNYQELKHLNLSNNEIFDGIDTLTTLPNLVTICLQRNKLSTLPDLSSSRNLQLLQADYNAITTLARFRAPSLFGLTLSRNKLTSLRDVTADFPNVESLDLSFNQLTSASGIEAFSNVRHLNLSHNAITSLAGLQKLTSLQSLDISSNKLKSLQEFRSLSKLTSLTTLIVARNPGLRPVGEEEPDVDIVLELLLLLPKLSCIDSRVITAHERVAAAALKADRDAEAANKLAVQELERAVNEAEAKAVAAEHAANEAEAKRLAEEVEGNEDAAGEGAEHGDGDGGDDAGDGDGGDDDAYGGGEEEEEEGGYEGDD